MRQQQHEPERRVSTAARQGRITPFKISGSVANNQQGSNMPRVQTVHLDQRKEDVLAEEHCATVHMAQDGFGSTWQDHATKRAVPRPNAAPMHPSDATFSEVDLEGQDVRRSRSSRASSGVQGRRHRGKRFMLMRPCRSNRAGAHQCRGNRARQNCPVGAGSRRRADLVSAGRPRPGGTRPVARGHRCMFTLCDLLVITIWLVDKSRRIHFTGRPQSVRSSKPSVRIRSTKSDSA